MPTTNKSEFGTFISALKQVLSVPHSEMKAKLEEEKKEKKPRKASFSDHVSDDRD